MRRRRMLSRKSKQPNRLAPLLKSKKGNNSFSNQELLRTISRMDQSQLLAYYHLNNFGLDEDQHEERLDEFGKNELDKNKFRWLSELVRAYFSPFNIILLIISIYNFVAYGTKTFGTEPTRSTFSLVGAIVVLLMVIISGSFTFIQAYRGYNVTTRLKSIISNKVNVIRFEKDSLQKQKHYRQIDRDNYLKLIRKGKEDDVTDLVPGDLIYLSSGDMIPADVRIVYSSDLFINQSALTGESMPIEKHAVVHKQNKNILAIENICFTGTSIVSGTALALVIATGEETYFSSIGQMMSANLKPEDTFTRGVRHVTRTLLIFMFVMVPLIYFIFVAKNASDLGTKFTENPWFSGLFFAIALVVALTPEMLPLIITTNLSNGASRLSKSKVVVKHFDSIQALGAIDVLATDKTGTLTNDKIKLVNYTTIDRKAEDELIKYLFLNSYYQTGLKNPMDRAIVEYVEENNRSFIRHLEKKYAKIDEIPFDFDRRKLTIVFEDPQKIQTMVTKGSVEEILQVTTHAFYQGKIQPLTEPIRRQIQTQFSNMNARGERVLGIAYKVIKHHKKRYNVKDESNLIFYGFANFLDTPKPSAVKMIKLLKHYGVDLKILTGDNEQVTRAICNQVGMKINRLVSGPEIEELNETELRHLAEQANVFVKLTPLQKVQVLRALKANKHNVGYLGDGINDAPVLYQADVAISVNNAADIAKEASDIILLEKNLGVLERGIVEGRTVFGNILKYMKITIASQFGNAFSMVVATAAFGNLLLAMEPIQTLFQNLIYDFSQLAIAFDYVDEDFILKPRRWTTKDLVPFAIINGLASSIFDITNYMIMGYGFGAFHQLQNNPEGSPLYLLWKGRFQASTFLVGLSTQAMIFHILRTEKIPFFQSRSPWFLYIISVGIVIIAFLLSFIPEAANLLEMKALFIIYLPIALGILFTYMFVAQIVKMIYIKIFHKWL